MKRINVIFFAILMAFVFSIFVSLNPVSAITAGEIIQKVKTANPGLKDYRAKMKCKLNASYNINIGVRFKGDFYYKAPFRYKIKLHNVPSFMSKYQQTFVDSFGPIVKPQDYNYTVMPDQTVEGVNCHRVVAVPKQEMGDLLKVELWVNSSNYILEKLLFYYKNEGKIERRPTYSQIEGFWLPIKESADFNFPSIKLQAKLETLYDNFKLNQNYPDSMFTDKQ
ncbi:MAG: outer membrane lipoprotein-sorting protein [Firmicutes bacterium]|nr:outer membrane lipoprotein-sorting protein [Bacillota bacterium]